MKANGINQYWYKAEKMWFSFTWSKRWRWRSSEPLLFGPDEGHPPLVLVACLHTAIQHRFLLLSFSFSLSFLWHVIDLFLRSKLWCRLSLSPLDGSNRMAVTDTAHHFASKLFPPHDGADLLYNRRSVFCFSWRRSCVLSATMDSRCLLYFSICGWNYL